MGKRARSAPAPVPETDPLATSVDRLTAELTILRQVIDDLREDFSWVIRNGIPVQPIEHVVVKRMALNPLAGNWNELLQVERFTTSLESELSPLNPDALDRIADDLKTTFEAVAQGQLEVVLLALDGVRGEVLSALKRRSDPAPSTDAAPVADHALPVVTVPPTAASCEPPPAGQLF